MAGGCNAGCTHSPIHAQHGAYQGRTVNTLAVQAGRQNPAFVVEAGLCGEEKPALCGEESQPFVVRKPYPVVRVNAIPSGKVNAIPGGCSAIPCVV